MQQKEFKTIEEQLAILKSRRLNIIDEEAFIKIAETYFYQRTHYCEASETIKYTYRAREHHNLNKSYINRIQATILDYYMNKKILENKDINY